MFRDVLILICDAALLFVCEVCPNQTTHAHFGWHFASIKNHTAPPKYSLRTQLATWNSASGACEEDDEPLGAL